MRMTSFIDTIKPSNEQLTRATSGLSQDGQTFALEGQRQSTIPLLERLYRGITSPIRLLPHFLVIGAQRGGTTSLYYYLQTHPCIRPTTIKEVHFFDRRFHKGLAWYRGHFPTQLAKTYAQQIRRQAFVTGEASPSYLFHPHAPKRVKQALPHVKLIVLLRNPVDRSYSQYYHSIEQGHETRSFQEAIDLEEERTRQEREKILKDEDYESYAYRHHSYLSRGIYVEQLQAWMELFPREQFLILKSEDFYANPAAALKEVLTFLNVPVIEPQLRKKTYKQHNNTSHSEMDAAVRNRLVEYFKPHNARLYGFLGVDFGWDK